VEEIYIGAAKYATHIFTSLLFAFLPEPQLRSRTNRGTERRERERFIHLNVFIFPGAKGRPSAAGLLPPGICWKKVWAKGSAGGYASRLGP